MAIFEGTVSIFERNGALEIRRVSSGGYDASEVKDLMSDILVSQFGNWCLGRCFFACYSF